MYFELTYDGDKVSGVELCPDEQEDPDELSSFSKVLKVRNPVSAFAEQAKLGYNSTP